MRGRAAGEELAEPERLPFSETDPTPAGQHSFSPSHPKRLPLLVFKTHPASELVRGREQPLFLQKPLGLP